MSGNRVLLFYIFYIFFKFIFLFISFCFSHFIFRFKMCEFGTYPRLRTPSSRVDIIPMFVDFWYLHGLPIWIDPIIYFYIMDVKWDFYCGHFTVCIYELSQFDRCEILHYFHQKRIFIPIQFRGLRYINCCAVISCCTGQSWFDLSTLILS